MMKRIQQERPFQRPNGMPGKFEWDWKHLLESGVKMFIGTALTSIALFLLSVFIVIPQIKGELVKMQGMNFLQNKVIIFNGKLLWGHTHPGQAYPFESILPCSPEDLKSMEKK
jgi:hypothetical protein